MAVPATAAFDNIPQRAGGSNLLGNSHRLLGSRNPLFDGQQELLAGNQRPTSSGLPSFVLDS
jgi:hypothetical protein